MADTDILIIGGGPAGLALALALAPSGQRITVADARTQEAGAADPRALALAYGSQQILDRLGVWAGLDATAIETIHVSQQGGFGRTLLHATELDVPALGHVVAAGALTTALRRAVADAGIEVLDQTPIASLAAGAETITATPRGNSPPLRARLVVRAEGAPDADGPVKTHDYHQHALIATVQPRDGHKNLAFERFTAEGPLALLPFGQAYASVLVASTATARRLAELDDDAYLAHMQRTLGARAHLATVGPRTHFPLALRYRPSPTGPRTVALGNAAQTLHPVAGQGFNLALRDVSTLARALRDAADPGSPTVLQHWARQRRLDRVGTIAFTDGLIRLFSQPSGLVSAARGAGLLGLDLCPPLRHFVARRMMFGARAWP